MSNVHAFPRSVRDYQIRINSFNILDKPLTVDGMNGPATRNAIHQALANFSIGLNAEHKEDLFDPSGITRIHWHWTAGSYTVSPFTLKHYNDVFDKEGNHYDGIAPAQQQAFYIPGRVGVSHTLNANTGAIGLSVACMAGATARGTVVNAGVSPITMAGIDGMLERSAEYCRLFDVRVSKWTCLTHAEVQPSLGIRQRGKWDIRVLPNDLKKYLSAEAVGNFLRNRMVEKFM